MKWLGFASSDWPTVRRLGGVLAASNLAEVLAEGAATAALLARVGAAALPLALALRASCEVVVSLGYDRMTRRRSPQRTLSLAQWLSALALLLCAAVFEGRWGAYAVFVTLSSFTRLRVIHFGVLSLSELGEAAPRALPAVYAAGRLGAILAGPLLALSTWIGLAPLFIVAAASQGLAVVLLRNARGSAAMSTRHAAAFAQLDDAPPSTFQGAATPAGGNMVTAILLATIALAVGRLALTTQSGAILEARFDEHRLAQVLGVYFAVANLGALLLQIGWVGRALGSGRLPLLNSGWAVVYLGAQTALAWLAPSAGLALAARGVEGELRNAVRTPVANLLYDVLPVAQQARSRTWVIGVALPLASLCAGALLTWLGSSPPTLAAFGITAGVALLAATLWQNRIWTDARRRVARPLRPSSPGFG